jgi:hypothetical protein
MQVLMTQLETAARVVTGNPRADDYTAQERAALVAWHLAHGDGMRIIDVRLLTGLSYRGACHLMFRLSRVIPIYCDEGVWQVCALQELI